MQGVITEKMALMKSIPKQKGKKKEEEEEEEKEETISRLWITKSATYMRNPFLFIG